MEKSEWLEKIINKIKDIVLESEDFKKKGISKKSVSLAHEKITDMLEELMEYDPWSKRYGIDFINREERAYGKIRLAVEVDSWWRPHGSWMKLADIRAENKLWIYITNSPEADRFFENGLKELSRFLKSRKESKETFGNFIAIMKTLKDFKIVNVFEQFNKKEEE
jgi:hypothetical protein